MTIELKYDVSASDWHRFMPSTVAAICRWASVQGKLNKDDHGYYYDLTINGKPKMDLKRHRVLRPATLHLGATKVLQEAAQYGPGWSKEIADLMRLVSKPNSEFRVSHVDYSTLDLITQVALFRGEMIFP